MLQFESREQAPSTRRFGIKSKRGEGDPERRMTQEEFLERKDYVMQLLPGAREILPDDFLERPFEYALQHLDLEPKTGKPKAVIKHESKLEEIVWKFPGLADTFVLKRIQTGEKKMPNQEHELRMLQRAQTLDLPAPAPLGIMRFKNDGPAFLMMKFVSGVSGMDLYDRLLEQGDTPEDVERKLEVVCQKLQALAEQFRRKMEMDKHWWVKDCQIHFDADGEVVDVFPLDFELAHTYDPAKPDEIDTLEIIKAGRERRARRKAALMFK